ncbi:hypothetical protein BD289DRAFT_425616 [Coniella lustricola]|uniref:Uncharacterized protein n=1 Tax=Coniella lustricola TaxID=2025994 RepID=A0A2T3AH44_9PEZI|nr:hypothetical protein BD289DRAFT_425616 [Coniella lustricola]
MPTTRCGVCIWECLVLIAQYEHVIARKSKQMLLSGQSASHSPDSLQMRCPRRSWSLACLFGIDTDPCQI